MDDGGKRNTSSRNAERRSERQDAWVSALGKSSVVAEDDGYRGIRDIGAKEIPEVIDDDGTRVRVVCGNFWGKTGPVEGIAADPQYLDVSIPPNKKKALPVETFRHSFVYIFEGSGTFPSASSPQGVYTELVGTTSASQQQLGNRSMILFDRGDEITVQAGEQGIRFLLVSGKPLKEPIAWYGPIVMNTKEEITTAIRELQNDTFIK